MAKNFLSKEWCSNIDKHKDCETPLMHYYKNCTRTLLEMARDFEVGDGRRTKWRFEAPDYDCVDHYRSMFGWNEDTRHHEYSIAEARIIKWQKSLCMPRVLPTGK